MKRMDAHIQDVVVFVEQTDGFLFFSVVIHNFQPIETTDSMVNMAYKITGFQIIQLANGQRFLSGKAFTQVKFMVTLKNLMIGINSHF